MRQLASVQEINTVEPIPNADAIERLRVLGWWVVAKRGEYAVGDRVVYCEIDSLLPERPEFEFLRPSSYRAALVESGAVIRPAGFRIRTVKLRGQVSQGICFPLAVLPPGTPTDVGTDVTEALGVAKYEAPVPAQLSGRVLGGFPGFLTKTDETRVQVLEGVLARHRGKPFVVCEKLDGTSFTAFVRDGDFGICSRNYRLDPTDESNALCRLATRLDLEARLRAARDRHGFDLCVQGEAIGPAVQGNKYGLKELEWRVFTVTNLAADAWLAQADLDALCAELGLATVPNLGTITLEHTVDELVALAAGTSVLNPKVQREGVVLRPPTPGYDAEVTRLSFKVINPAFLLKYDE